MRKDKYFRTHQVNWVDSTFVQNKELARKCIKVSSGAKACHRMVRCSIGLLSEIGHDALEMELFRIFSKCGENAWSIKEGSLIPIQDQVRNLKFGGHPSFAASPTTILG